MPERAKPERKYLTKTVVEAAQPYPTKDHLIWDTDRGRSKGVAGFALKVRPSGHKTFIVQYRFGRRMRRCHIGEFGEWTVERARNEASRLRSYLSPIDGNPPRDPFEVLREERRPMRGEKSGESKPSTLGELCDRYLEMQAKKFKRPVSWKEDERRIKKRIKPNLGHLDPERISADQVEELYQEIGNEFPIEANRTLVLLASIYTWGIKKGKLSSNTVNPARRTEEERFEENERPRYLKKEERPRLLAAIEAEQDPYVRALFLLLLTTGLRKSEWLGAKRSDIDFEERELVLPKARTKSKKTRTVPLSAGSIRILQSLPDEGKFRTHLFPAHDFDPTGKKFKDSGGEPTGKLHSFVDKPDRPMNDPKRQWRRVRKAAGCDDIWIHDLRRTASRIVLQATHDPKAAQKVLGHADLQTTLKHYATVTKEDEQRSIHAMEKEWQAVAEKASTPSKS